MKHNHVIQKVVQAANERKAEMAAKHAAAKPVPKPGKEEDGITIKSSTPGSDKRFRITVDDNGVISAVEVK